MNAGHPNPASPCNGLSAAVISDALDSLGLIHQAMAPTIRPLDETRVLCGRARTGRFREIFDADPGDAVFVPVIELVDTLGAGEVMVLACEGTSRIPTWGELLSIALEVRGAVGCVTDGLIRDVRQIRQMGFPSFAAGYGATVTLRRAALISSDKPVLCGGVWVSPGDLVFGDADGVVVIPRGVEEEVLREARRRAAQGGDLVRRLREGASFADVRGGCDPL